MTRYNITAETIIVGIELNIRLVSVYFYLSQRHRRRSALRRPAATADAMIMTREDVGQKKRSNCAELEPDDVADVVIVGRRRIYYYNIIMTYYKNENKQLQRKPQSRLAVDRPIMTQ